MQRFLFTIVGALLLCAAHATSASAFMRTFINCPNGVPCGADVQAHIDAVGRAHLPWVISVAVPAGVCFIAYPTVSDAPVAVTVVAPDGVVYRARPAVTVGKTAQGWYTVELDSVPPAAEQIVTHMELEFIRSDFCQNPTGGR